jgi:hypothetical protein
LKPHYHPPDQFSLKWELLCGPESIAIEHFVQTGSVNSRLQKVFFDGSKGKGLWGKELAIGFFMDKMGLTAQESVECYALTKSPLPEEMGDGIRGQ